MIVHILKMCTSDAGPEQSLVLFYIKELYNVAKRIVLNPFNFVFRSIYTRFKMYVTVLFCDLFPRGLQ